MAELQIKNNMEFFYIEEKVVNKLLDELECRFKFQKVLIVGACANIIDEILSQKQREICYIFDDKFDENLDDIVCVVCFDETKIRLCKLFCFEKKINFVLVLDSFVGASNFCLEQNKNQLIGVILDKQKLQNNFKNFAYDFVVDCAETSFTLIENKINQLYFFDVECENLSKKTEKIQEIVDFFAKNNNLTENFEKIMDYYFDIIMLSYNQNSCYISEIGTNEMGYSKLVKIEILLNLYAMFLSKSSPLICKSASGTLDENFAYKFDENKFWFVNGKFKLDIISLVCGGLDRLEKLKTICTKIDADRIFLEAKNLHLCSFKKQIFEVPSVLKSKSLIKVINYFGLLNF